MPKTEKTYRELQSELDEILLQLQASELDVDEAVKLYKQGLKVVQLLEAKLTNAENEIAKLKLASASEG